MQEVKTHERCARDIMNDDWILVVISISPYKPILPKLYDKTLIDACSVRVYPGFTDFRQDEKLKSITVKIGTWREQSNADVVMPGRTTRRV